MIKETRELRDMVEKAFYGHNPYRKITGVQIHKNGRGYKARVTYTYENRPNKESVTWITI